MSAAATVTSATPGSETIRFEASTRAQAESLAEELAQFAPRLERHGTGWMVEIAPDRALTPLLLDVFGSVSRWLSQHRLASVEVHFGETRYTLLHPSEARPSHPAEFLLQRVIQLQTALESRTTIEQAKGILAGRLHLGVDEAFAVLRHAARRAGRELRELSGEVLKADELPPEVMRAFEEWRRRHRD
jgi:hypothetical protein